MNQPSPPHVLVVDDDVRQEEAVAAGLRAAGLSVEVRLPADVTVQDLAASNVVAVDHYYDWNVVPHPREPLYWPHDGLAIAGVVAGQLRELDHHSATVLRTGDLGRLAAHLPRSMRQPIIAAQNNLDWVLVKGDERIAQHLRELAAAVEALRSLISRPSSWDEGSYWLNVPDSKWREAALADVQVCHPPENTVAEYTAGSAWLRWFLHRIIPFPTFLLPNAWAANLLRVEIGKFEEIVTSDTPLARAIGECRYTGNLAGFATERWWRSGLDALVDDILWNADPAQSEAEALAQHFSAMHGSTVSSLDHERAVVTIDGDYAPDGIADADECVRLAPDFWPSFAQEPWARIDDVYDDDILRTMIARGDRSRVTGDGEQ